MEYFAVMEQIQTNYNQLKWKRKIFDNDWSDSLFFRENIVPIFRWIYCQVGYQILFLVNEALALFFQLTPKLFTISF